MSEDLIRELIAKAKQEDKNPTEVLNKYFEEYQDYYLCIANFNTVNLSVFNRDIENDSEKALKAATCLGDFVYDGIIRLKDDAVIWAIDDAMKANLETLGNKIFDYWYYKTCSVPGGFFSAQSMKRRRIK